MMEKNNLKDIKLDLKAWKNVELSCMQAIAEAESQLVMNDKMLSIATIEIHLLGGLTHAETIEKENKERKELEESNKVLSEAGRKSFEEQAEKDQLALENNEPRP